MRKWRYLLAFAFLFCVQTFGAFPTSAREFEINLPCFACGNFLFNLTGYYERATPAANLEYALIYPESAQLVNGRSKSLMPGHDWAYSIGMGYIFPCSSNDIRLTYYQFDNKETQTAHVPNGGILFPTLSDLDFTGTVSIAPLFAVGSNFLGLVGGDLVINLAGLVTVFVSHATDVVSATATTKFRNTKTDLDVGQYVDIDTNLRIRMYAGLRYASLKHQFNVVYNLQNVDMGEVIVNPVGEIVVVTATANVTEIVDQKTQFTGIGPRFGVNATLYLGGGFGLTGSLGTALLIGNQESKLRESATVNTTAAVVLFGTTTPIGTTTNETVQAANFKVPDQTRVVPNIEGRIGLDYTMCINEARCSNITLGVGYQVDHYFSAMDGLSQIGIDRPEFRTRTIGSPDFNGFYFSGELRI